MPTPGRRSPSVSNTKYLDAPRMLAYRPSISSVDRSQLDPAEAVIKDVELHFKVDRDGRIDDVTSPTTDVPENIVQNSMTSMKRSRYAPRIENGAAVPTRQRGLHRTGARQSDVAGAAASPSGKAEEKAPEETGEEQAPEKEPEPRTGAVATTGASLIGTASMRHLGDRRGGFRRSRQSG